MVRAMDAPAPDPGVEHPSLVSRRQLLWLASGVGLAATGCGCAHQTVPAPDLGRPQSPASAPNPAATAANEPSPTTVPPSAQITPASAASAAMLCRDAWGARPAHAGGRQHSVTRMTLHHAGVVLGDNRNAPGRFRQDQRYHQDQLGWIDIAYHVGIDRNGNIYELRRPELAGDTATEYDTTGHFLVFCEGDFDKEAVSEAQLNAAASAFAWAARHFGVATDTLAGHRDFAQTSCPGANLYSHVSSGDLKHRVDTLLAAGGVDLQLFCGPDATARVAAIEAGN
jgi:hypothetical protein